MAWSSNGPHMVMLQLPLHDTREAVVRRPAVEEIALGQLSLRERADEPCGEFRVAERQVRRVHLMAAVAAVLLPLASHAVHKRFLGRVVERVDAGFHQPLQGSFRAGDVWRRGPRVHAAEHTDMADRHRALHVADMQLQPAEAFVVECAERVVTLAADEPCPGIEVCIEECRGAGGVCFVGQQFDDGACGGVDGEFGEPDDLFFQLKRKRDALAVPGPLT